MGFELWDYLDEAVAKKALLNLIVGFVRIRQSCSLTLALYLSIFLHESVGCAVRDPAIIFR